LEKVKEQFAERAGPRGEPRLWRGLRQITEDDIVEDQKRTCKIDIADDMFKTVVDKAEAIIQFIEAEHGLTEIYICDAEDGEAIDWAPEFDGRRFAAHQAIQRHPGNHMIWPGETSQESVIKGTGREIKQWVEEQIGCEVIMRIMREGMTPVMKELHEERQYEDVEFLVKPLGKIYHPEYKDWSQFSLVRDPNCRQRIEASDKANRIAKNAA
jgi:hypothetical protein